MLSIKRLTTFRQSAKRSHQKIVLVSGCFDLLHIGHLRFLKEAKKKGDLLAVAVLSDDFVRDRKGAGRPIFDAKERLEMIQGLKVVDLAIVISFDEVEELLRLLQPNGYVVGGDRKKQTIPEEKFLQKFKIPSRFTKRHGDRSTTKLIPKLLQSAKNF
ncbi:D-glycero-beta-D-manno-heptose 1-phosphate adenylyltransferase [candidate division WWE3 bacterium CG06_land_8_20_14_3_00_42_16]|uniref:D-glycero-beta-D-manno-heptose 1-phosphate adenylyltransferase n=4 Tax=Katanobacteria TaxID=422282 RepID=A0A2M7ALB6_UNCKA|nr:MAG: hypothetical protein AUJ38_02575 [bacterium CG1_02_42_9]PIU68191.1 MAG: D-glycero-beta-D-manno-heptose 1-phosphate adenylyltransferase [candidate division WWE3 bacterium CG06_land_8_20_14_3_00_42_16]PIZ43639.1 MAG: D-glycero-beta-D-manno-heptose 1-phosphate adenylyltransferase [candidate division WWE3 bacterium CG_4_10_14_0_2_um_filter_42_8]PJA38493.1 MAG: D-glycero-beta-D-manno-heptose 1-phosphate adenylyltransferase [candidate division WWE3 bacterium CG_4_9_14_3_um_filter_43_9]PJC6838